MDPNQQNTTPAYPKPDEAPVNPAEPTIIRPDSTPQQNENTPPPVLPTTETPPPASAPLVPSPTATEASNNNSGVMTGGVEPLIAPEPKKKSKKLVIIAVASIILLVIAGAGFYFGYYTNSKLAYGQALSNSGKALAELTNELTTKPEVAYKSYTGTGTYKVESADFSTDGKLSFKADDKKNIETTFDVGVGLSRIDIVVKSLESNGTNPDLYIKAGGIKGLGDLVGPELGAITSKYDDKWIVIDHTLLDNAQKQLSATESGTPPTREQIVSAVNAFSAVNQEYIFSTDDGKAVLTVIEDYGMKNVDDRDVFHYKVGINKDNLKKYLNAQEAALKTSTLNEWIKGNDYTQAVEDYFDEAAKSVDDIKSSDTFDMYVDAKQRIVYKLRFDADKNPAVNYVEVGLNYKDGDELPFFIVGKSKEDSKTTDFDVRITANAKTKAVNFKLVAKDDSEDKMTVTTDFTFKPSTSAVTITKPEGAVQLATLLEEIGLGDPFGATTAIGETLGVSTQKKN